ncbi:hypothetical protein HDU88_004538 [Geranomyces variabilis]|nr:hypothetical protein HDU88_004538 [Geranomyces variabilis]
MRTPKHVRDSIGSAQRSLKALQEALAPPASPLWEKGDPPHDNDAEYEVDKVVDHKIYYRKPRFLVRWVGGAETWEPEENLVNCQEKVDEYLTKKEGMQPANGRNAAPASAPPKLGNTAASEEVTPTKPRGRPLKKRPADIAMPAEPLSEERPPVKRRGRLPKKMTESAVSTSSSEPAQSMDADLPAEDTPARRGRVPQQKNTESDGSPSSSKPAQSMDADLPAEDTPARRGRPPKQKNTKSDVSLSLPTPPQLATAETLSEWGIPTRRTVSVPIPKKAGAAASSSISESDTLQIVSEDLTPARKPGRPPTLKTGKPGRPAKLTNAKSPASLPLAKAPNLDGVEASTAATPVRKPGRAPKNQNAEPAISSPGPDSPQVNVAGASKEITPARKSGRPPKQQAAAALPPIGLESPQLESAETPHSVRSVRKAGRPPESNAAVTPSAASASPQSDSAESPGVDTPARKPTRIKSVKLASFSSISRSPQIDSAETLIEELLPEGSERPPKRKEVKPAGSPSVANFLSQNSKKSGVSMPVTKPAVARSSGLPKQQNGSLAKKATENATLNTLRRSLPNSKPIGMLAHLNGSEGSSPSASESHSMPSKRKATEAATVGDGVSNTATRTRGPPPKRRMTDTAASHAASAIRKNRPSLPANFDAQEASSSAVDASSGVARWSAFLAAAKVKGLEVVNDEDDEGPPDFEWTESIIYRDVPPPSSEFLVSCDCYKGICKDDGTCVHALDDDENSSPYDRRGRVTRPSNVGAIWECNFKCGCKDSCPQRVVQRGRKLPLQIFRCPDVTTADGQMAKKGWGVKTLQRVIKGTFVCQYKGELITTKEGDVRRTAGEDTSYFFGLDFFVDDSIPDEHLFIVDAGRAGNEARFLNHSCDPNLAVYAVHTDNADPLQHALAFFALRDIAKGEELTFSYNGSGFGQEEEDAGGAKACLCATAQCRGILPAT